jgi:hypothetical protein
MNKLNPWRELAAFGLLSMDISWGGSLILLFSHKSLGVPEWQVFLAIGGASLLIYVFGRASRLLRLKTDLQTILAGVLMIAGVIFSIRILLSSESGLRAAEGLNSGLVEGWGQAVTMIPAEFVVAVVVLLMMWRSLRLSRQNVGPMMVKSNLRTGVILLLILGFLFARVEPQIQPMGIYLGFLFSALFALGSARISVVELFSKSRRSPFDRNWILQMTMAILAFIGISSLMAYVLMGQMGWLSNWLERAIYFLGVVLLSPFILLAYLFSVLWGRFASNATPLPAPDLTPTPGAESPLIPLDRLDQLFNQSGPNLVEAFKFVFQWGGLILGIVLFVMLLRRVLLVNSQRISELEEDGDTYEQLGSFARMLREAILGEARQAMEGFSNRLNRGERLLAAARIRRIYTRLLDLAKEKGVPRLASQTPLEFLNTLDRVFSGVQEDLCTITDAYVRVRYGEYPETQEQVDEVEKAWLRVRAYEEGRNSNSGKQRQVAPSGLP